LLAPPLDRDDPQGEVERSAVKLLGELRDRRQPVHELLVVDWALDHRGWRGPESRRTIVEAVALRT
jgi:hypothetical protein